MIKKLLGILIFSLSLTTSVHAADVDIAWNLLADGLPDGEVGVWIHIGNSPGVYTDLHDVGLGRPTSTTLTNLSPGVYCIVAEAYHEVGEVVQSESGHGNEVCFSVQNVGTVAGGGISGGSIY